MSKNGGGPSDQDRVADIYRMITLAVAGVVVVLVGKSFVSPAPWPAVIATACFVVWAALVIYEICRVRRRRPAIPTGTRIDATKLNAPAFGLRRPVCWEEYVLYASPVLVIAVFAAGMWAGVFLYGNTLKVLLSIGVTEFLLRMWLAYVEVAASTKRAILQTEANSARALERPQMVIPLAHHGMVTIDSTAVTRYSKRLPAPETMPWSSIREIHVVGFGAVWTEPCTTLELVPTKPDAPLVRYRFGTIVKPVRPYELIAFIDALNPGVPLTTTLLWVDKAGCWHGDDLGLDSENSLKRFGVVFLGDMVICVLPPKDALCPVLVKRSDSTIIDVGKPGIYLTLVERARALAEKNSAPWR